MHAHNTVRGSRYVGWNINNCILRLDDVDRSVLVVGLDVLVPQMISCRPPFEWTNQHPRKVPALDRELHFHPRFCCVFPRRPPHPTRTSAILLKAARHAARRSFTGQRSSIEGPWERPRSPMAAGCATLYPRPGLGMTLTTLRSRADESHPNATSRYLDEPIPTSRNLMRPFCPVLPALKPAVPRRRHLNSHP